MNEGHAMVVVGYNHFNKEFELMNSWGPDWGDGGFIKVKYDDFLKRCIIAYQITMAEVGESLPEVVVVSDDVTKKTTSADKKEKDITPMPKLDTDKKTETGKVITIKGDFKWRYMADWDDEKNEALQSGLVKL